MTYSEINEMIFNLKVDANEKELECLNTLHDQFNKAGNAEFTINELSEFLKSENDCLDGLEQDSWFYEDVRNIQDAIINYFSE